MVEAGGELLGMVLGAADPDRQEGGGEVAEHRVGGVVGIDHLAERSGGVGDEVVVAVEVLRLVDEGERVAGGGDLGGAVLALAAQVLLERDAALVRAARLAEVGRERREVLEGDVGGDVDRIAAQQVAQEGNAHRLALEVVDDVLAHVAGADAEIDGVVKPVRPVAQHGGDAGLAEARHAEHRHALVRGAGPVCRRGVAHGLLRETPVLASRGRARVQARGARGGAVRTDGLSARGQMIK